MGDAKEPKWTDGADLTLAPGKELPGNDQKGTWVAVCVGAGIRRVLVKGQGSSVSFKSLNGVHELKVQKIVAVAAEQKGGTLSVGKKPTLAAPAVRRETPVYVKAFVYYDVFPEAGVQFLIEESPT
jgi:hypothetical protein